MYRIARFIWIALAVAGISMHSVEPALAGTLSLRGEITISIRNASSLHVKRMTAEVVFPEDYLILETESKSLRVPVHCIRYMQRVNINDVVFAVEFTRPPDNGRDRDLFRVVFPQEVTVRDAKSTLEVSFEPRAANLLERLRIIPENGSFEG